MIAFTSLEGTLRVCVLRGELTTVRLLGELDLASTDVLAAAETLVPEDAVVVTVDLDGLTFLDGTGADALAAFHAAQVVRGRRVRFTRARPRIRRIFGIFRMGSLLLAPPPRGGVRPVQPHRPDWFRTTPLPEPQEGPTPPPH